MRPATLVLALLCCPAVAVAAGGCTASERPEGTLEAERLQRGDTTVVRTTGGSLWGDSVRLVEEVAIGVLEGPDEYQFGQVSDLAVDAGGGIYVFDAQVPSLRYYDATGSYVRTLGGEGQGPGEYLDVSLGLAVRHSDGRLVMRDPRNSRLNVYEPDGSPSESWRVESGLFTSRAMVLDSADHMWLKILTGPTEQNAPWPVGLLHLDAEGEVVDTLVPPLLPGEPSTVAGGPFGVGKVWAMSPLGGIVVGVNRDYVLHHYRPGGTILRIERTLPAVPVHPEEQAEHEARLDWLWERQGQFMTAERQPVPDLKPAYRSVVVGEEGRIWVRRYVEAEKVEEEEAGDPDPDAQPPLTWVEPPVYDVFEPDGRFLGSLTLPPRTTLFVFRGDRLWGLRSGEFDETYVVGFRIEDG